MKKINIIVIIILLLLILVLIMALGLYYIVHKSPFSGINFNHEVWIAAEKGKSDTEQLELDNHCMRGAMVADLKENYLKSTITQADVVSLLGKTRSINNENDQSCLRYNLGICSGFKMDYDSLDICFKGNKFIYAITIQH